MNGCELAKLLSVRPKTVYSLIKSGHIKAKKEKGKLVILAKDVTKFQRANARAIDKLKGEYVRMYWQGLSVEHLQRRVPDDFESSGIVLTQAKGFAERCIYESLPKRGQGKEG